MARSPGCPSCGLGSVFHYLYRTFIIVLGVNMGLAGCWGCWPLGTCCAGQGGGASCCSGLADGLAASGCVTRSCPWAGVFTFWKKGPHLPPWFLSSAGLLLLLLGGLQAGKSDSPHRPEASSQPFGVGSGAMGCRCQRGPCHSPSCFSRDSCEVAGPQAWVTGGIESHRGVACLDPVALVLCHVRWV